MVFKEGIKQPVMKNKKKSSVMSSEKATILIIEDEQGIVEFLQTGLEYEGYKVIVAKNGISGLDYAKKDLCDVVILDIMLPDIDGFEVCEKIRESGNTVPVLMLTAKKDVTDRVKGLNIGADDYLTKPFSFDELLARIQALLRRSRGNYNFSELRIAGISLNKESKTVTKNGVEIKLTPKEYMLLELFMEYPKRVFTRETLLSRIFGYNYVSDTNIIDVHISHLREKLGDKSAKLIRTRYGIGYTFNPGEDS